MEKSELIEIIRSSSDEQASEAIDAYVRSVPLPFSMLGDIFDDGFFRINHGRGFSSKEERLNALKKICDIVTANGFTPEVPADIK